MGNNLLREPRIGLEKENATALAIHIYRMTLNEVAAMVSIWECERCPLMLEMDLFAHIFGCGGQKKVRTMNNEVSDAVRIAALIPLKEAFAIFDTNSNGKIDAFEVLASCCILCRHYPDSHLGISEDDAVREKALLLFELFNWSSPNIRLVETEIVIDSAIRGLRKLLPYHSFLECGEDDKSRLVANLWTAFNLDFQSVEPQLSSENFAQFITQDGEMRHLAEIFLYAFCLDDALAELQEMTEEQHQSFYARANQNLTHAAGLGRGPAGGRNLEKKQVHWALAELYPQYDSCLLDLAQKMAAKASSDRIPMEIYRNVMMQWNVYFTHIKHLLTFNRERDSGLRDFFICVHGIELRNLLMLKYGSERLIASQKDGDPWCAKYLALKQTNNWDFVIDLESWIEKGLPAASPGAAAPGATARK